MLLAVVVPASAAAADELELGPNVIHTGEGPTGYEVTFRYDAPDDVEQVSIWGEWEFSNPEILAAEGPEGRMGSDWQEGDTIAASGPGFFPSFLLSDMTEGEDGVWTWTTPLPSGLFSYRFAHDCDGPTLGDCEAETVDPANPGWAADLTPTGSQPVSSVYVPKDPAFPTTDLSWQAPTTPEQTGTFEHREYDSPESTNPVGTHYLTTYLPAGYDADRAVPYPTLYLSHGFGGNETTFFVQALAHTSMENLVADGEAQPMVIVATNFNGLDGQAGYAQDVHDNVIPFIEQEYNVSTLPEDRAFGGQSMGGSQAFNLLYNHTSTFEYYGLWASAGGGEPDEAQLERLLAIRGGIHMGTGLQDTLGNIGANSQARVQMLRGLGVDVDEFNTDGTHTWVAARPLLHNFLQDVAFRTTETSAVLETDGGETWVSATVEPLGTSQATPTGTVEIRRGDEVIGSAPVDDEGNVRVRLDEAASDTTEAITAHYLGDALFNASTSDAAAAAVDQVITVTVPESAEPGEFLWSIRGDGSVDLGATADVGTHLEATGPIDPIRVTDTRAEGPSWSISGQVGDFSDDLSGNHLGWTPEVISPGAGAVAGDPVPSGIDGGPGLSVPSTLASASDGHDTGTALVGADLELKFPADTEPGDYSATLTITALS